MPSLNLTLKPELKSTLPVRVLQFGEGNFLRGFIDWMVFKCNEKGLFNGRILALQPTPKGRVVPKLLKQDCLYTTILHGMVDGHPTEYREVVNAIAGALNPYSEEWLKILDAACAKELQFVFSNTTEAGIAYVREEIEGTTAPSSFPAKLTALLLKRFRHYGDKASAHGLIIMPCELIDDNGTKLKEIVLRHIADHNLGEDFKAYVEQDCRFLNTLVDRVVSGYPTANEAQYKELLGYDDELMTSGEIFGFMAIEGGKDLEDLLPFAKAGLNVVIDEDISKYRLRKVRLLNGGHTANVPAAYLAGFDTVDEMMSDPVTRRFFNHVVFEEIIPALDLDPEMLTSFAKDVANRFSDKDMHHQLASILMNCTSKLKARVLSSLLDARAKDQKPRGLCFSVAAYLALYMNATGVPVKVGRANGVEGEFRDDEAAVAILVDAFKGFDASDTASVEKTVRAALSATALWDQDLTGDEFIVSEVCTALTSIARVGVIDAMPAYF